MLTRRCSMIFSVYFVDLRLARVAFQASLLTRSEDDVQLYKGKKTAARSLLFACTEVECGKSLRAVVIFFWDSGAREFLG